jgi:hypothetical protein
MKLIYTLSVLSLMLLGFNSFAVETATDCPMMKEMNERSNPKATMQTKKSKTKTDNSGAVAL